MNGKNKAIVVITATAALMLSGVAWAQKNGPVHEAEGVRNQDRGIDVVIKVPSHAEIYHGEQEIEKTPPAPPQPPPPPPPPPLNVAEKPVEVYQPPKKAPKKVRKVRITIGMAMLPFQVDAALSRNLSFHGATFFVATGRNKNYYGGLLAGFDYALTGRALEGLSLGIRAGYVGWGTAGVESSKTNLVIARSVLGYKWIWDEGFTMNIGLGMQYIRKNKSHYDKPVNYVLPHAELAFGFAF